MVKKEKLTQAKYSEFQASLWGAMGIAFGLGALLSGIFGRYALLIIVISIPVHAWGMMKVHNRNK